MNLSLMSMERTWLNMDNFRKEEDREESYFPEGIVHDDVYFDLGDIHLG